MNHASIIRLLVLAKLKNLNLFMSTNSLFFFVENPCDSKPCAEKESCKELFGVTTCCDSSPCPVVSTKNYMRKVCVPGMSCWCIQGYFLNEKTNTCVPEGKSQVQTTWFKVLIYVVSILILVLIRSVHYRN